MKPVIRTISQTTPYDFTFFLGSNLSLLLPSGINNCSNSTVMQSKYVNGSSFNEVTIDPCTLRIDKSLSFSKVYLLQTTHPVSWKVDGKLHTLPKGGVFLVSNESVVDIYFTELSSVRIIILPFGTFYTEGFDIHTGMVIPDVAAAISCILNKMHAGHPSLYLYQQTISNLIEINCSSVVDNDYTRIGEVIRSNARDPDFSLERLSQYSGYPKKTISSILRSNHTTFKEVLGGIRAQLLTKEIAVYDSEVDSLEAMARRCGFSSYGSALRLFKKNKGLTFTQHAKVKSNSSFVIF